jgi:hypothetical protein
MCERDELAQLFTREMRSSIIIHRDNNIHICKIEYHRIFIREMRIYNLIGARIGYTISYKGDVDRQPYTSKIEKTT